MSVEQIKSSPSSVELDGSEDGKTNSIQRKFFKNVTCQTLNYKVVM